MNISLETIPQITRPIVTTCQAKGVKTRIMLEGDPKKSVPLSHFTMTFYTTKKSKKIMRTESERVRVNRINEQFYK